MMLWIVNSLLIATVLASTSSKWIEHYLTTGIHRKLTANNSAVYYTFAHSHAISEVRKNLFWILDPCGSHEDLKSETKTIACRDTYVKEIIGNTTLTDELCTGSSQPVDDMLFDNYHPGFEAVWVGEEQCTCSRECHDGTTIDKWPACSCQRKTTVGFKYTACNFFDQCDWSYEEFKVIPKKPGQSPFHIAYAVVQDKNVSSLYSPYYSQFTSSCALSFFYNLAGTREAEIRIYLEWRKYPGQSSVEEDLLISTMKLHQENRGVLDYYEVPIGFVTKHARLRMDCLVANGEGRSICRVNNLTWNNCAERDLLDSPCHSQTNPTLCVKDGMTKCLEDVTCDGIKDCPSGEDEENCDYVEKPGSKCNFNAPGMCGWEEKAFPLRRDGKKIFLRGKLLPNMSIVDEQNTVLESFVMRETPRPDSGYFLLISSNRKQYFDSREYYFESSLFPPTRQFTGDTNRPEAVCSARFRYCVKGTEQKLFFELERSAFMQKSSKVNIIPLWEPPVKAIAETEAGSKCEWHMASIKIPRQILPFRLRFGMKLMSRYPTPMLAIDDFSLNPTCFDFSSHTGVNFNQTFATCGKTGTEVPTYDDCRRESLSTGGSEVEVNDDGSRTLTIAKDGFYWMKLCGAAGGSFPKTAGGAGNCVAGTLPFEEGNRMKFILGQKGASPCRDPTDTLSVLQEKVFKYVCKNASFAEDIDPALYIGAGGGGLSALYLPNGSPGLVVGGGGGAFPKEFKPKRFSISINGNGMSLKPNQTFEECNSDCAEATPKHISDQGFCYKKVPFETQGGYGGGGTSCGTGGGGGAGYFGGKFGRFAQGLAGSNYVNEIFNSAQVTYLDGTNHGDGSLTLVRCNLECPQSSFCDFLTDKQLMMACTCGPNKIMINDTCVLKSIEEEPVSFVAEAAALKEEKEANVAGHWILGALFLLVVLVLVLLLSRYNYRCLTGMGKKHFQKGNGDTYEDALELLDVNQAAQLERLFDNQPFIKNLPSKNLLMLLKRIDDNDLTLMEIIGRGAFGNVSRGILRDPDGQTREVAVKVLNNDWSNETESATRNFITEALLMSLSNNVGKATIELIGVVLDCKPYKIVMELMKGGNLLNFLRSSRPNDINENPNNLFMRDLIQFAKDIVEGCMILEKNQHLHRDLAARNCLLTKLGPGRRVKIGDFGLATELFSGEYVSRARQRAIPVKWMPPEAIEEGIFSTKTDVWSFGVVCWEIFTIGQVPYPTVPSEYLLDILAQGKRLAKPKGCPNEIYEEIMLECWQPHPDDRPTFSELDTKLSSLLEDIAITGLPIPLVYGLEKVSSPVLEDPVFNPILGTPVTIETALPTPLTTEDHWSSSDITPGSIDFNNRLPTPPAETDLVYQEPIRVSPTPLAPLPLVTTFKINNNTYWKGCPPSVPTPTTPERPTQLQLSGVKYRECKF